MGQDTSPTGVEGRPQRIAVILALALCLRLGLFLVVAPHPERFFTPDSQGYISLALHFRDAYAGRYADLSNLALVRTPGYPLVINAVYAAAGERPWAVILLQIALSVLTVWLTYVGGLRLFGPRAAWWAAAALAMDPISIIMPSYLQPEVAFTVVLLLGFRCWLGSFGRRAHVRSAGAGVLLGASALVRPISLYLPVFLIPAGWFFHGRRARALLISAVLLAAFALPVGGWTAVNYRLAGVPMLSTVQSYSLLFYRAGGALAHDEHLSLREARDRLRTTLNSRVRPSMNRAEISRLRTQLAIETLTEHPVGAWVTFTRGAVVLLAGPGRAELLRLLGAPDPLKVAATSHRILVGLELLIQALSLLSAGWGCYALLRARRYFELVTVASFIMYYVVASAGPESYSRFRAPIVPYLALLAGCGIASRIEPSLVCPSRSHRLSV
jgi:4-amino-4-deoxy-L-arabinose transferase-like glycosyltransferase